MANVVTDSSSVASRPLHPLGDQVDDDLVVAGLLFGRRADAPASARSITRLTVLGVVPQIAAAPR